jgi:murein DD-endopeptidase MepM/ murein hydrolase activator NlpD
MFPLAKRKVQGYSFGQKTFYGTKHTGTDYLASYVNYYAPFDGYATAGSGPEGGTWWQLTRSDGTKFIARHLSKLIKVGKVRQGELVGVTGNSGAYTTNPHLHQEVYIKGKLSDPEKFNWVEETMKLVKDKGTVYLVSGNKDKRKIGIADLKSLGLFGDEQQEEMDTSNIPEYNTIVDAKLITHK